MSLLIHVATDEPCHRLEGCPCRASSSKAPWSLRPCSVPAKDSAFATAQMRCNAEDGESLLVSVIAFSASAAEALARLAAGDTVAVAGPAALSRWEKDGEPRVGLKVTATRVLTVYDAGLRRKATGQGQPGREPQGGHDPWGGGGQAGRPGRSQFGRRRELVRQPPVRFDDDDGEPV